MYNFIATLPTRLPCYKCSKHYVENLKILNFSIKNVSNRLKFSKFMYDLYHLVNKQVGNSFNSTFEE
eukprot:Pgem_evm2s2872